MENSDEQTKVKHVDYLVATLLDFFRHPKNEMKFLDAAKFAINQLNQPVRTKAFSLEKRFYFFASKLKNNITVESIKTFAHACYEAVERNPTMNLADDSPKAPSLRTLHKKAATQLNESLLAGHSEGASIYRAANQLLKAKKKIDQEARLKSLTQKHPLRETLEVLQAGHRTLAKEDIKQHFLRLKKNPHPSRPNQGMLFSLLEKAQAFSTSRLHKLLGDELFFLCRPLGFLDQNGLTIIVEVPTSAHLHALTYRKNDILKALKKDPTFRTAKDIRLKVSTTAF